MNKKLNNLLLVTVIFMITSMTIAIGMAQKVEAASAAEPNPAVTLITAEKPPTVFLFKNVKVFDGVSDVLKDVDVLVVNNLIRKIGKDLPVSGTYELDVKVQKFHETTVPPSPYAFSAGYTFRVPVEGGGVETKQIPVTVIDGGGRTLMPGLIEGHGHFYVNGNGIADIENNLTYDQIAIRGAAKAKAALMSGFTTWRDAGGMAAGLKKNIDEGLVEGPRIYPSGAFIGPTGSHADFRNLTTPNETMFGAHSSAARNSISFTADSPEAIKTAARQNFMQGATQLKIMSSGGILSQFDPWQLNAFSAEDIQAAVEVADAYGSYVMSHAYSKTAIMRCLDNGVKSLEHNLMFDEEIAKKMVEKGAYMTTNVTSFSPYITKIDGMTPISARKANSAQVATANFVENVKKFQPKFGFNTDAIGGVQLGIKQTDYSIYLSGQLFGNLFTLKSLTSVNGEIVKLAGEVLDPYFEGSLGVIEVGAYADILIVDGNPLEDLKAIGANEKWFDAPDRDGIETIRIIMKDGKIYKNTL
ncbi:metal-dependent hydrolase family protein [Desulfopila aestuarii]|uniref:Imidazolonepropionase n=1 Tax=Desulfopila aestuarii DSM 18488 TaxID=1121416 RepID=A0A1M7YK12_9BACT|nr:amidohydrolase family protein [Desulfopila aestuarii]SHO52942.1 Imidazolonepropionase [Desulfopila aestuarii DSM 18488]